MVKGLSPRVRGNRVRLDSGGLRGRSIPACAGEPLNATPGQHSDTVYPRVCGGTDANIAAALINNGLSPRVRGNLRYGWPSGSTPGSIPACAGEPVSSGRWR